jgi:hypothetical protein
MTSNKFHKNADWIRPPGFNPVMGLQGTNMAMKLGSTIIYSQGSRVTASQGTFFSF